MSDLRHALRQLAKSPGFTLLAVLSLAVGIGINSTIFSAMDAAFLRPLPVERPDEIVKLERPMLSFTEFEQMRPELTSLSAVAASNRRNLLLMGSERTELLAARSVSSNYFTTFGVTPAHGRLFSERSPDLTDPIVVVSDALWQRRFGGDPKLIGQTISLNGVAATVVGIAPRGFTGEDRLPPTDVWYPAQSRPRDFSASQRAYLLAGRMQAGFTVEQVRAQATTIFARPQWQDLGTNRLGERVRVVSEAESRMDHGGRLTYLMGPVVGLVLLVACANVSCLLLGRYEERRREIAVRLALGAGHWRVMRFLLTEALMLSLAGGGLGLLFTVWGLDVIPSILPPMLASWAPPMHVDGRVLVMTLGLSVFATLAFGLVPAWRAARLEVSTMLKSDTVHLGKTPSRSVLVVAQVIVAVVFLAIAALFVRGFLAGANRDLGFSERNVLFAYLVPERGLPRELSPVLDEVRQTVAALPGVRAVTLATHIGGGRPVPVLTPDDQKAGNAAGRPMPCNAVDPGYFGALGIPLLQGRDFTAHDNRAGGRVAIVSEAMAKRLWPGESAVGQTLFAGRAGLLPREVVGVVRDVTDLGERPQTEPQFYFPVRQELAGDLMVIVTTTSEPGKFAGPVRAALKRMDASMDSVRFDTIAGLLRVTMLPQWFGAWLGGVLGGLAFVLAISGLYGVVAYAVSRRTREIGIRIAIGAAPRDAVWLVLRQGLVLALIGVCLGLPVAMMVGSAVRSVLFGISPTDPVALAGSALLVVLVAGLASYLPARRAAQVNPIEALRAE
jgi:putative ABC transport system permease protein